MTAGARRARRRTCAGALSGAMLACAPAPSLEVALSDGNRLVASQGLFYRSQQANPGGLPKEVFDGLQAQLAANRSQFYRDLPEKPAFSRTDFTDDLKKITVPVLVMHGDDDQIVPYVVSSPTRIRVQRERS
jgi:pimeloyl-ACP methyl ester carboxylesterase